MPTLAVPGAEACQLAWGPHANRVHDLLMVSFLSVV